MQDGNHFGTRCWVRQRSSRVVYSRNETSETHFPCAERNHLVALPMPGTGRSCRRVPSRATAARIADGSCADNSGPGQAGVNTCPRIDAHTSHHRHCDTATRAAAHYSGSAITHTTAHKHSARGLAGNPDSPQAFNISTSTTDVIIGFCDVLHTLSRLIRL